MIMTNVAAMTEPGYKVGLRNWLQERNSRMSASGDSLVERNNTAYLMAFLEANDDLFDHAFRASLNGQPSGSLGGPADSRVAVEKAARVLREEERRWTFGGGVPPAEDDRLPAFVTVERSLAHAPTRSHRIAIRAAWDTALDVESRAVHDLAVAVRSLRAEASDPSSRGIAADNFVETFSGAVIDATSRIFGTYGSSASSSLVSCAELAMEETPAKMMALAFRTREPMLDVGRVIEEIRRRLEVTTDSTVRASFAGDRWEVLFGGSSDGKVPSSGVVIWPLNGRNPDFQESARRATPLTGPGVPTAHVGLRCSSRPDGRLVMHLRDLKATLHELGHAMHHGLTASREPLRHGLESAGETEIDLLSLWLEWTVFDAGWGACALSAAGEPSGKGLVEWQGILRLEALKELPLRALVMELDREWLMHPESDYQDVWRQVTDSDPAIHASTYLEALHRLTWPIPVTRPGAEYGLFWAMSEVAGTWMQRHGSASHDQTPPAAWFGRILGNEPHQAPDPMKLISFLEQAVGADTQDPLASDKGNPMSSTREYPSDYIAAMLPARDPELTSMLRQAIVDEQLPPIQVDDNAAKLLECLTLLARPQLVIEIGALFGYSTIHLARGLKKGGQLISFEIDPRSAEIARENVSRFGLDDRVRISTEDAVTALSRMAPDSADLIFIDGAKTEYVEYVKAAFPLLRAGGALLIDDAFAGGSYAAHEGGEDDRLGESIRQVVGALAKSQRVTASFLGTEHGMLLAVKQGSDDE
ncbi:O-methyltransferase [Paenarthrobacter nitroguajacolicus]|uniref:O-methyltransferase n=1 Tax=Paenarthrobacter nitroguajacolicus TaxID=211146 RepID=UPI002862EEB6|nr:O-methyltransferase [Paenarthrobacter nitroguajacolicus]MDR6640770.1 putative O-methyltransferase YrrM [Paenarthrobacter nitroguajacolicus]